MNAMSPQLSRGGGTPLELFCMGLTGWEAILRRLVYDGTSFKKSLT